MPLPATAAADTTRELSVAYEAHWPKGLNATETTAVAHILRASDKDIALGGVTRSALYYAKGVRRDFMDKALDKLLAKGVVKKTDGVPPEGYNAAGARHFDRFDLADPAFRDAYVAYVKHRDSVTVEACKTGVAADVAKTVETLTAALAAATRAQTVLAAYDNDLGLPVVRDAIQAAGREVGEARRDWYGVGAKLATYDRCLK